jgi:AraC-like DNA-binding protein
MVHHQKEPEKIGRLSQQLPKQLGHGYSFLSKLFSTDVGMTIEKYLILQKIEKAKELLIYEEHTVSEIAFQLNYSSSQHFSRQFKAVTGLSPSLFMKRKKSGRKPLDGV